jgi:hypothetical protein
METESQLGTCQNPQVNHLNVLANHDRCVLDELSLLIFFPSDSLCLSSPGIPTYVSENVKTLGDL